MLFIVVVIHRLQDSMDPIEYREGTAAYIYLMEQKV